jgi:hypothetical protein
MERAADYLGEIPGRPLVVDNVRVALGLPVDGGADKLCSLVSEVGEEGV